MNKKVSIIIPVYNVEEYIDRCMESVVNQTYPYLEILIMEAQSEDDSLRRVKMWEEQDKRITVISRRDRGLGDARNMAMKLSHGDYVLFLDSDDWLDKDFVEKMLETAEKDRQIDIVMGDAKKYIEETVVDLIGPEWPEAVYETDSDKKKIVCFGSNFIWGKLFRKSLFLDNGIIQPILPFEDLAVYPALIFAARKIATCHGTYANYQADRENCLSSHKQTYKKIPEVYDWAEKSLKSMGIYETCEKAFQLSMYSHFRIICLHCLGKKKYAALERECPEIAAFMEDKFSKLQNSSYIVYGGFSLRWIISEICNGLEAIRKHITFTSVIAQMSTGEKRVERMHYNDFRQQCINDDINGYFLHWDKKEAPQILFIDFMQECTDILTDEKGNYITCSEALEECGFSDETKRHSQASYRRILWSSDEFWDLWQKKCREFIQAIGEAEIGSVFLIKNRLATTFQKNKKICFYISEDEINRKNKLLDKMYAFFEKEYPSCIAFQTDNHLGYTDMVGKSYPPKPEYMNISFYRREGIQIQSQIYEDYLK